MDIDLSQNEAIDLINTNKVVKDLTAHSFPAPGGEIILKLESEDQRSIFSLILGRNKFELAVAYSIHHMFKKSGNIPIIRLDIDGPDHKNPDATPSLPYLIPFRNTKVGKRHMHVYVEGFGLTWAFPVKHSNLLRDFGLIRDYNFIEDHVENTRAFFNLINIVNPRVEDLINTDGFI